jgi:hypothetical protein
MAESNVIIGNFGRRSLDRAIMKALTGISELSGLSQEERINHYIKMVSFYQERIDSGEHSVEEVDNCKWAISKLLSSLLPSEHAEVIKGLLQASESVSGQLVEVDFRNKSPQTAVPNNIVPIKPVYAEIVDIDEGLSSDELIDRAAFALAQHNINTAQGDFETAEDFYIEFQERYGKLSPEDRGEVYNRAARMIDTAPLSGS